MSSAELPKHLNLSLPTVWVDMAYAISRNEPAVTTIRFFSVLPEAAVEVVRIQTPTDHVKRMLDAFAKMLNYYPTPPEGDASPAPESNGNS